MFDRTHIIYIVISLLLTAGMLVGFVLLKSRKAKDVILKFFALATVILHISGMWVDFLKNGSAGAADNILFPIYFCNLTMWLLLITAFVRKKSGDGFKWLAQFTAYAGILGALISLFYPSYYVDNPTLANWGVLKSMLSHSTMLAGCLCLLLGGYFKIGVVNLLPFMGGLIGVLFIGFSIEAIFAVSGLASPNAMYLMAPAIDDAPLLTGYFIGIMLILVVFVFTFIYELIAYAPGERWYKKLTQKLTEKKEVAD